MATFFMGQDDQGRFRFILQKGDNILLESEAYQSKDAAKNGVESVRKNSTDDARYVINADTAGHGGFYLSLKAGNGQVIGHSRGHKSKVSANANARLLKNEAADADVVDYM